MDIKANYQMQSLILSSWKIKIPFRPYLDWLISNLCGFIYFHKLF